MSEATQPTWSEFQQRYLQFPEIGLSLDLSRMGMSQSFLDTMAEPIQSAVQSMAELEGGAIANPDENRMVGHYWLRDAERAPQPELTQAITATLSNIQEFAREIIESGDYVNFLLVGIGGSALGPQFVSQALGNPRHDKLRPYFFDNTDPDGMEIVLQTIGAQLVKTLCIVVSKSGGTKETRNGMLVAKHAYESAGLRFEDHAVAVTSDGSKLDLLAQQDGWKRRFPMWDWVGGRTSETSAVGLLPAALQGIDINPLLQGAKACDEATRTPEFSKNPAALLALAWYHATDGRGSKDMVILPYKDRLELFSRYLQQLVMESLGKELDLDGNVVNQGITVYGNKGSTDQHAYIQQLREGVHNFFVTFIEVLRDSPGETVFVEEDVTPGDYLEGFYLGTREALYEKGRQSITLTIPQVDAFRVGMLIALFERAVGLYATLTNINAYHQPGVEAGKKAAESVLELQLKILAQLRKDSEKAYTVVELAVAIGDGCDAERVFKVCQHLAANPWHRVSQSNHDSLSDLTFQAAAR